MNGVGFKRLCVLAGVLVLQRGSVVRRFEIVGERDARALCMGLAQGAQLVAALGDELVFVVGGGGVVLF
jgi:hypothetical protein